MDLLLHADPYTGTPVNPTDTHAHSHSAHAHTLQKHAKTTNLADWSFSLLIRVIVSKSGGVPRRTVCECRGVGGVQGYTAFHVSRGLKTQISAQRRLAECAAPAATACKSLTC